MIVCATPRCGGTIFCIDKAVEIGGSFMGELSPVHIKDLGAFGDIKQKNHETGFQPVYDIDEYFSHLDDVDNPRRIYLVNDAVTLALPKSEYRIATRQIDRALCSLADLVIRSRPAESPEKLLFTIAWVCRALVVTNVLITRYCMLTGKQLLYFEDMYSRKTSYPNLERFSLRCRLEDVFSNLAGLDEMGYTDNSSGRAKSDKPNTI